MDFSISNYEIKDSDQVKQIIQLCSEEAYLLDIINGTQQEFAYSIFADDSMIALLAGWKNKFHPETIYFRILIHPFYDNETVAENLLCKLESFQKNDIPLQTSLWESSSLLMNLYIEKGFKVIRKTYMPRLDLAKVSNFSFSNKVVHNIRNMKEISVDSFLMEKLAVLVKINYEKSHMDNPVAEFPVKEWINLILAEDLLAELSSVLIHDNEITAYSFFHESEHADTIELGWAGASESKVKSVLPELLLYQLKQAGKRGYQFATGEYDTTDEYAMEVFNHFPFAPAPAWVTLRK